MATIIQEVIDQLQLMDESLQQQVLSYTRLLTQAWEQPPKDLRYWLEQADIFQEHLESRYGKNHFDSQEMLDELHEGNDERQV